MKADSSDHYLRKLHSLQEIKSNQQNLHQTKSIRSSHDMNQEQQIIGSTQITDPEILLKNRGNDDLSKKKTAMQFQSLELKKS